MRVLCFILQSVSCYEGLTLRSHSRIERRTERIYKIINNIIMYTLLKRTTVIFYKLGRSRSVSARCMYVCLSICETPGLCMVERERTVMEKTAVK